MSAWLDGALNGITLLLLVVMILVGLFGGIEG